MYIIQNGLFAYHICCLSMIVDKCHMDKDGKYFLDITILNTIL